MESTQVATTNPTNVLFARKTFQPETKRRITMKIRTRALNWERPLKSRRILLHTVSALSGVLLFALLYVNHDSVSLPTKALRKHESEERNTSTSQEVSTIEMPKVKGGKIFRVPAEWNRIHVPWFQPHFVRMLTPEESHYRYLYASTRIATSDGIGHSMGVINREFNLALRFNLTYTHRVGLYSSLTASDPLSVEHFFGWGEGEVPRTDLQAQGCIPKNGRWPEKHQIYDCHECGAPLSNGSLKIKHIVAVPSPLGSPCHYSIERCDSLTSEFLARHHHSHTIFQTTNKVCGPPATDANFVKTKNLFFHKYWNHHGNLPWGTTHLLRNMRPVRYREIELNVAIHVRRGDFLDPAVQAKRGITKDTTFAKVLVDALSIVHQVGGPLSDMPVVVHIYSEGKLTADQVDSVHSIKMQDQTYYDSSGTARGSNWWQQLISQTKPSRKLPPLSALGTQIRVAMHISEDTLLCLHEMISADIFIGSKSGLSNALVWSLSRGIVLIPHAGTINTELGAKGYTCCSVPFENSDGSFIHALFKRYWKAYVQANADSARRAISSRL